MKKRVTALLLLLSFNLHISSGSAPQREQYDVLIVNGKVVDGAGNPWIRADVAIRGDRIGKIGKLEGITAARVIDAQNQIVAPGFIDIMGQSEIALLRDGDAKSKTYQGVTTEIYGEGNSAAPINDTIWKSKERDTPEPEWKTFDEYFAKLEQSKISINAGTLLGGGTVRLAVMGFEQREPRSEELDEMRKIVDESMRAGTFGLATALIYPPGSFASTAELIELSKVVAKHGGIYISHMRSEAFQLLQAIDEIFEIAGKAEIAVEIYHLKSAGKENWPLLAKAISKIEQARQQGIDITADVYPYTGASTGLDSCIPPEAFADGKLKERLKDPAVRAKFRQRILNDTDWENLYRMAGPEGMMFARIEKPYEEMIGKTVAQIASEQQKDPIELIFDLVAAARQRIQMIYFLMNEDNVRLKIQQPWVSIGTDAAALNVEGPLGEGKPHPRAYGTFPRILKKYVREEGILKLEDAIRKFTSLPAQRLGIRGRGLLREGMYADVVVFDPQTITDRGTYENPHQFSEGVNYLLVNGEIVISDGKHTGARPGRVLRHGR